MNIILLLRKQDSVTVETTLMEDSVIDAKRDSGIFQIANNVRYKYVNYTKNRTINSKYYLKKSFLKSSNKIFFFLKTNFI